MEPVNEVAITDPVTIKDPETLALPDTSSLYWNVSGLLAVVKDPVTPNNRFP